MRKTLYVLLAAFPAALSAGPIVYTPVNPSFGGNPLNGPNLANQANSAGRTVAAARRGASSTKAGGAALPATAVRRAQAKRFCFRR